MKTGGHYWLIRNMTKVESHATNENEKEEKESKEASQKEEKEEVYIFIKFKITEYTRAIYLFSIL